MKNIFIIILATFLTLNAQIPEQTKKQLKDAGVTADQAKRMTKDQGLTDQQIEDGAIISNTDLDTPAKEETPSQTTLEVIEIDGVKYIKDGLRYIPVLSGEYDAKLEKKELENVTDEQEETLDDELEIIEEELVLETIGDPRREATTYYGYQIFQGDPDAFQASTFGSVDPNYNVGPEDQIIVLLWGEAQFRQEYIVGREGNIFIEDIGPVSVNGLNLETLEKKFFQIFSKLYSTLNPISGQPTTYLDLSLGNLRPLRVIVLGEVAQPGAYTVSPSTSLSSVPYYFRGPTTMGSLRDIRLIRQGITVGSIDYYDYLLSGKTLNDFQLQLDDIVFIPPRRNTVSIYGEINRPAIYELHDNEGLKDLIEIAGGLRITAYMGRAQIDRVVAPEQRSELGMDRMLVDLNLEEIMKSKEDYPIQDGDIVKLFSILNMRENTVSINGAIVRPGIYDYGTGLTVRDLILLADSLVGDAYLERADVVRINPDFTEKLLKLDLRAAMAGKADHSILLQPMDRMRVYSLSEMVAPQFVSITGYVQFPGRYPLRKNMNLYDLIFSGGGLADDEWLDGVYMERADLIRMNEDNITSRMIPFNMGKLINNLNNENINWALESGDVVRIYSKNMFNTVKPINIDGAVRRSGSYTLKSNMTIKDLILEAGGVSENVYSYKIEVARINPLEGNKNIYAQIISLDMRNDFTISNIQYQSSSNPGELSVKRNEFELQPYDRISIRPDPNFSLHRTVTIDGEVNYPGTYTLTNPIEKVSDIIRRAGGLRPEAYPKASSLIRNNELIRVSFDKILKNDRSKDNFELLDGDSILINARPNIVVMVGELNTPGNYKYYSNKNIRGYIKLAGGVTVDAENREIRVTYPDGTSKQLNRFLPAPKVFDGSIITVGSVKDTEPLDRTEFAKEVASIIADFLNIYISLTLLVRAADTL
jgi:protein involved in polysaccharide export with SLBB domain